MNKFQILVVEDDPPIRKLIATTLKTHDYKYLLAQNAEEALMQASTYTPDVMFLDLGLPDLDGVEVIRRIREWSNMPIIVISARSEDEDKIEALDAGADDYLTKPFSVEELLARLRVMQRRIALLRSDSEVMDDPVYVNGELKIDYAAGCAYLNGEEIKLTPIEYKLLCLLARNTGRVLTHKYITQKIWGSAWDSNIASLRVFMATLRKKLEKENGNVSLIQTHIGIGYRMLRLDEWGSVKPSADQPPRTR
ncbi:MAG: response regulator transcription factor [Lachnospiraceae bacterium]|nr:response regulator transcription factor [Lachnospiraceae bacterium]